MPAAYARAMAGQGRGGGDVKIVQAIKDFSRMISGVID